METATANARNEASNARNEASNARTQLYCQKCAYGQSHCADKCCAHLGSNIYTDASEYSVPVFLSAKAAKIKTFTSELLSSSIMCADGKVGWTDSGTESSEVPLTVLASEAAIVCAGKIGKVGMLGSALGA